MKRSRHFLIKSLCIALALGLAALYVYPSLSDALPIPAPTSARAEVTAAWQRARQSGAYHFASEIVQNTVPLPLVTNIGRRSQQDRLRIEGHTNLPARQMQFTLWSQGGSVLNAGDGVSVRVDGDHAYARQGDQDWQEVNNFVGGFANEGDFMSFLAAAKDIEKISDFRFQILDLKSNPQSKIKNQKSEIPYARYTFTVDGPGYAAYVRDQMQQYLAQKGELPHGMSLGLPEQYSQMTGHGELWLDADGYPRREILHLVFPPPPNADHYIEADITSDFSQFPQRDRAPSAQAPFANLNLHIDLPPAEALPLALSAILLLFVVMLFRQNFVKRIYTPLTLALVFSIVFTPMLNSVNAAGFLDRQAARAQTDKARQHDSDMQRTLKKTLSETEFDPHVSPVQQAMIRNQLTATGNPTLSPISNLQSPISNLQLQISNLQPLPADHVAAPADHADLPAEIAALPADVRALLAALPSTNVINLPCADPSKDSDGDGLPDCLEEFIGTDPYNPDSDGDGIPDSVEVQGFDYAGKHWYLDPLKADSNNDGIADGVECPQLGLTPDQLTDGHSAKDLYNKVLNNDPSARCQDTNGDGVPDVFDRDNDGDGVPDKFDLSPYQKSATTFTGDNPFLFKLSSLQPGMPTYVEFQLRPTDPNRLWYAFNVLDWPEDKRGQVQDGDGKTFYDVAADKANTPLNPNANGDMRLVPMLEIQMDTTGGPKSSNLPLLNNPAPITVNLQGTVQGDNYAGSNVNLTQQGANLNLRFTINYSIRTTFHVDVFHHEQVTYGKCSDITRAGGQRTRVASFDGVSSGDTRSIANLSLLDIADGTYSVFVTGELVQTNACADLPRLDASTFVDTQALASYGISFRKLDDSGNRQAVYVPLQVVNDDQQTRVAFQGKMFYLPQLANWGRDHSVRLVWMLQMLVDVCDSYTLYLGALGDVRVPTPDCQHYSAYNQLQVVHVYTDDWILTGLNVREDRGTDVALIYEDPAVDTDKQSDSVLFGLAYGLERSFLVARDDDNNNRRDMSVFNDQGDSTIAARFDRTINSSVPITPTRFNLPNILRVVTRRYDHQDQALAGITMTETKSILSSAFTPYWSSANPLTPTLMIARESRFRATNLDALGRGGGFAAWTASNVLSLNLAPPNQVAEPMRTALALNLAPYCYNGSEWKGCDIQQYWNVLGARYADTTAAPGDSADIARGKLTMIQLYYLALYKGITTFVPLGNIKLTQTNETKNDGSIAATIVSGGGAAAKGIATYVVNQVALSVLQAVPLWTYLGKVANRTFTTVGEFNPTHLKSLVDFFRQSWGKIGLKLGVGLGVGIVVVLITVATFLGVYFGTKNVKAVGITAAVFVGLALFVLQVVLPVITVVKTIVGLVKSGANVLSATASVLGASSEIVGTTRASAVVGLIIQIGVAAVLFIVQIATAASAGTLTAYQAVALTAQFIATVIVAIVLFVISLKVIGLLIVALLGIVDIILLILCKAGDVKGACFGLISYLTEQLANFITKVTYYQMLWSKPPSVNSGAPSLTLQDPNKGFSAGNVLVLSIPITTTIAPLAREALGPDSDSRQDFDIDETTFRRNNNFVFELSEETGLGPQARQRLAQDGNWVGVYSNEVCCKGKFSWGGTEYETPSRSVVLEAGLNQRLFSGLNLNNAYRFLTIECVVGVCKASTQQGKDSQPLTDQFYFDVFPATLGDFYRLSPADQAGSGFRLAWDDKFPVLKDADGDGLLAGYYQGADPDDSKWDTDGDGLSDSYELMIGTDPTKADSDGDGLSDAEEVRLGTDPLKADTDNDGLTDKEEVDGWDFTVVVGTRSFKIHMTSNPLSADSDGDGISDAAEIYLAQQGLPYNPMVWNPNPFGVYVSTSDEDGIVGPGQTFTYTTRVRNSLDNKYWNTGVVEFSFPANLGGETRNLPIGLASFSQSGTEATLQRLVTVPSNATSGSAPVISTFNVQVGATGSSWQIMSALGTLFAGGRDDYPLVPRFTRSAPLSSLGLGDTFVTAVNYANNSFLYSPSGDSVKLGGVTAMPPAVTCAANGNCLVVYGNATKLEGQVFKVEPDPNQRGKTRFTFIARSVIDDAGTQPYSNWAPAVASDGTDFLVVYVARDGNVYSRRVLNDGTLSSGPQQILAGRSGDPASNPDVTWGGGQYWIVAQDSCCGHRMAQVDRSGSQVTPIAAYIGGRFTGQFDGSSPHIAFSPITQQALVVYKGAGPINTGRILWHLVYADYSYRVPWQIGPENVLFTNGANITPEERRQQGIMVTFDPFSRNFILGWTEGNNFRYRVSGADFFSDLQTVAWPHTLTPAGTSLACPLVQQAPMLSLQFEERFISASQPIFDSSGYGRNGTCTGGNCPTTLAPGVVVGADNIYAFDFNGSNQYLTTPLPTTATDNVSLSAWVKWRGGATQAIMSNGSYGSGYTLFVAPTGQLSILNSGIGSADSNFILPKNTWTHLAVVRERGIWKLYANGAAVALTGNPGPITPSGNFWVGQFNAANLFFNGLIDDVRVYNSALSPDAVRAIYGKQAPNVCRVSAPSNYYVDSVNNYYFDYANITVRKSPNGLITQQDSLSLLVDADTPTSGITSLRDGQVVQVTSGSGSDNTVGNRSGSTLIIGGVAKDPTSKVVRVEVSVNGGPWQPANGTETWAFPLQVTSEGAYTLSSRATDVVGNVTASPAQITIYADNTPPQVAATVPNAPRGATHSGPDGRWAVALQGTASDPAIGSRPGTGVQSVEVQLTSQVTTTQGNDWQPATLSGGNWSINYTLPAHVVDPSGAYTVTVRATDKVGNMSQARPQGPLLVDGTAPQASLGLLAPAEDAAVWYPFDEPVGATSFADASGQRRTASCSGAGCPTAGQAGQLGTALRFDGVDDFVALPNFDIVGQITLAAWIKPEATDGLRDIIAHGYALNPNGAVQLRIFNGQYQVGSWNGIDYLTSYPVPAGDVGQWVHLAGVYDGTYWRLYRNGVQVSASPSAVGAVPVNAGWAVGARGTGTERFFKGLIDDVRIYSRALSAQEVQSLRAASQPGNAVLHLPLNEPAGATSFVDASGQSHTATCGATCPTAGQMGKLGAALQFNGANNLITSLPTTAVDNVSLSAWVNWGGGSGTQGIVSNGNYGSGYTLLAVNGRVSIFVSGVGAADSDFTLPANTWTHLVAVRDRGTWKLYVNGAAVPLAGNPGPLAPSGNFWVGQFNAANYFFNGLIDDVHVYNRALSLEDVQTLQQSTLPSRITTARTFGGQATDSGTNASGVQSVELAYVPAWQADVLGAAIFALPFDEPAGAVSFSDTSGNTITRVNCTAAATCPTSGQPGRIGNALRFNGVNQVVKAPLATAAVDNVSLAAWVNWSGAAGHEQLILTNGNSSTSGYGLFLYTSGQVAVLNGGVAFANSNFVLPSNAWTHLTAVRDSGTWRLYVNGAAVPLVGNPTPNTPTGNLWIGNPETGNYFFNGLIDEVRVYNRALSPEDVSNLYQSANVAWQTVSGVTGAVVSFPFKDTGLCNPCPSVEASGPSGRALVFNGSQYVNLGGKTSLSFGGVKPFSIAAWVNPVPGGEGGRVVGKSNSGVAGEYVFAVLGDGKVWFYREGPPYGLTTPNAIPFGQYSQIVATYDGATMRIYVNGVSAASVASGAQATDTSVDVLIGAQLFNGVPGAFFNGRIDGVSIFDRALTDAEVSSDYQFGIAGRGSNSWATSVPALEGFYQLNLRATDVAGNQVTRPRVWRGEIDNLAPRLSATTNGPIVLYWGGAVLWYYTFSADDYWLDESTFQTPCPAANSYDYRRTYDSSAWWNAQFPNTPRLTRVQVSCSFTKYYDFSPPIAPTATISACDRFGHCSQRTVASLLAAQISAGAQRKGAADQPLLVTQMLTPTNGIVLTTTAPISVTGGVYAQDYVRALTVTVDSAPFYNTTWSQGDAITATTWTADWTPPGDGDHIFNSLLTDWAGRSASEVITVTVDTQPPSVVLTSHALTTTHLLSSGAVRLSGAVTDTGKLAGVQARVDGDWLDANVYGNASTGAAWDVAWSPGGPIDGATYTVTVRASDVGGHLTQITDSVTVDIVPPEPVTITLSYVNSLNQTQVISRGQTLTDAASLKIDWTASSSSDLSRYSVGWTNSPTPTLSALTVYDPSAPLNHSQSPSDPQTYYAHVVAQDTHGNNQTQSVGPIYVDAPGTPDLITDLAYHGWMENGCTLIGTSRAISTTAAAGASLSGLQKFYASWDASALRLAWTGANWDVDGDLFIYLDTGAPGGATQAYNPYPATMTNTVIYLPGNQPSGTRSMATHRPAKRLSSAGKSATGAITTTNRMEADYLVWVKDGSTATLLRWNGTSWLTSTVLSAAQFQLNNGVTDIYLPFNQLGITDPANTGLKLVALASEENALRLWATMPSDNPLNSALVAQTPGATKPSESFPLTHQYRWNGLGAGLCPNADQFQDIDLHVTISAEPAGITYSFVGDDLVALWQNLFGGGEAGSPVDSLYYLDTHYRLIAHGQRITYTIRYANLGTATAMSLTVDVAGWNTLRLPAGTRNEEPDGYSWDHLVINLGNVGPGASGTSIFRGVVDVNATQAEVDKCLGYYDPYTCNGLLDWASIDAFVDDSLTLGKELPLDWIWVDHAVDHTPPEAPEVQAPRGVIRPGLNTVSGFVFDESAVPTLTLEIKPVGGITNTLTCLDATPDDGEWACDWNVGAASDGDRFVLRARGTDVFGQVGAWSDPITLTVDTVAPTLALDSGISQTLSAAPLRGGSYVVTGSALDNRGVSSVSVCRDDPLAQGCEPVEAKPSLDYSATVAVDDVPAAPIAINASTSCNGSEIVRTFNVTSNFNIGEVRLGFNANHTYRGDIAAVLQSPAGTQVLVIYNATGEFGSARNFDVLLFDSATGPLQTSADDDTAAPYYDRQAKPYEALSAFVGESANGSWTLRICDLDPSLDDGTYNRSRLLLTPFSGGSGAQSSWSYNLNLSGSSEDNVAHTLYLYAVDRAGNRSAPAVSLSYRVDTVAPVISVTNILTGAMGAAKRVPAQVYQVSDGGSFSIRGTVSDGSGVREVRVRLYQPDGTLVWALAELNGVSWSYILTPTLSGNYSLWVEATDQAGNVAMVGPFGVTAKFYQLWFPWIPINSSPQSGAYQLWLPWVPNNSSVQPNANQATATPTISATKSPAVVATPTATPSAAPPATVTPRPERH